MFEKDVRKSKKEKTDFYLELKEINSKQEDIQDRIDLCQATIELFRDQVKKVYEAE